MAQSEFWSIKHPAGYFCLILIAPVMHTNMSKCLLRALV